MWSLICSYGIYVWIHIEYIWGPKLQKNMCVTNIVNMKNFLSVEKIEEISTEISILYTPNNLHVVST